MMKGLNKLGGKNTSFKQFISVQPTFFPHEQLLTRSGVKDGRKLQSIFQSNVTVSETKIRDLDILACTIV